jgi:hypothetical protein
MDALARCLSRKSHVRIDDESAARKLLTSMTQLQKILCRQVTVESIYERFITGLLASGRDDFMVLARDVAFPTDDSAVIKISPEKAVVRFIESSKSIVDQAPGDDGIESDLNRARGCLDLIPDAYCSGDHEMPIDAERQLIEGAKTICVGLGLPILPVQIRRDSQRLNYVVMAQQSSSGFYTTPSLAITLATQLGINPEAWAKTQVLHHVVKMAVDRNDVGFAESQCRALLDVPIVSNDAGELVANACWMLAQHSRLSMPQREYWLASTMSVLPRGSDMLMDCMALQQRLLSESMNSNAADGDDSDAIAEWHRQSLNVTDVSGKDVLQIAAGVLTEDVISRYPALALSHILCVRVI